MQVPDGSDLLAVCDRLVQQAMARGADQAEAYWQAGASLDIDIEAGRLAGTNSSSEQGGAVRVVKNGRLGFAYLSHPDHADAAIARAIDQARIGNGYTLPAGGRLDPLPGRWDDQHAALDVDAASDIARSLIGGATESCPDADVSGGGVGVGWGVDAVASSEGVQAWDRSTSLGAGASLVLADGDSAINAWDSVSVHVGELDAANVGRSVGTTVASLRDPAGVEAGRKDVVLLPDAGSELVLGVIGSAVDGDEAMRGRSVWSDRLGDAVAHPGLSIRDVPQQAGGIGTTAMDGEGLAALDTPVIDGGRLRSYLFDSWTGHRHDRPSTGHAQRGDWKALPAPGAHHWTVTHAVTQQLDELLGDVADGYLVESVLGAHTANATTGDFSVTAPNVWRIRDGAVAGACKEIAIGGNLPDLLGRLDGVSDAPKARDGALVPALRFRDVTVSV